MPRRADQIDVERQMRAVLLDGAAGHDADLAQLDGVVDLGPGQFFVAVLGRGAAGHAKDSSCGRSDVSGRRNSLDSGVAAPSRSAVRPNQCERLS